MYIVHYFILLRLNPLTLVLIERDGDLSTLCHSCGFDYQLRVHKRFPVLAMSPPRMGSLTITFTGKFVLGLLSRKLSAHSQQLDSNRKPYIYLCNTYIHIYCIYKYIYISITYTVEKKENALVTHSAMETWKHTIIRSFIILCLCPFSKISHPP